MPRTGFEPATFGMATWYTYYLRQSFALQCYRIIVHILILCALLAHLTNSCSRVFRRTSVYVFLTRLLQYNHSDLCQNIQGAVSFEFCFFRIIVAKNYCLPSAAAMPFLIAGAVYLGTLGMHIHVNTKEPHIDRNLFKSLNTVILGTHLIGNKVDAVED